MGIYIKGLDIYPAVVRRFGGLFEAQFVDIPRCVAFGPSPAETERRAGQALTAYARRFRARGGQMPCPSIIQNPVDRSNEYVAYFPVPPAENDGAAAPSWNPAPQRHAASAPVPVSAKG